MGILFFFFFFFSIFVHLVRILDAFHCPDKVKQHLSLSRQDTYLLKLFMHVWAQGQVGIAAVFSADVC